jgi:hypothetical protein
LTIKAGVVDASDESRRRCCSSQLPRAKAGSLEKLFIIADRVERGERLFHPGDNPILATQVLRDVYRAVLDETE